MHFPWEISRGSPKEAQWYFMGSSKKPLDENALIMYGKGSDKGGEQKGQASPQLMDQRKQVCYKYNLTNLTNCYKYNQGLRQLFFWDRDDCPWRGVID